MGLQPVLPTPAKLHAASSGAAGTAVLPASSAVLIGAGCNFRVWPDRIAAAFANSQFCRRCLERAAERCFTCLQKGSCKSFRRGRHKRPASFLLSPRAYQKLIPVSKPFSCRQTGQTYAFCPAAAARGKHRNFRARPARTPPRCRQIDPCCNRCDPLCCPEVRRMFLCKHPPAGRLSRTVLHLSAAVP